MYRYQKMVLKSDIIKEMEDQKKKQQESSGTSSTKKQGVSTPDQEYKKLEVKKQEEKNEKNVATDCPNPKDDSTPKKLQSEEEGASKNDTKGIKTTVNKVLPNKTLETTKNVSTQSEINTNVSIKSDSIIAVRNISECNKGTQEKHKYEVEHKDNRVKRKKKLKKKKAPKIAPKSEESNQFSCLPMYMATPVTFEETTTQTKPKKLSLPKKPPKAVLIGLPKDFHETLPDELASLGYDGAIVSKIKTTYLDYPPVLVQLPIGYDIGQLKKINRLSNCAVEIQIYTGVQCFNCKSFGHALKNCKRPPRCDKCGFEHFICECHKGETGGYCSLM